MQVGNTTGVQQPAGTNGDYLLMAQDSGFGNGAFLTGMPLSSANVTGPLKINFDMFKGSPGSSSWTSFTLRSGFNAWPVAGSGELGFLYQSDSGIQIFNNGGGIGGFTSTTGGDSFAFYLTDRTGTGSPFTSDLTRVVITQGAAIVGSYTLNTGMTGSRYLAFGVLSGIVGGVDNLAVTPMQSNILPATTDLSLTAATSALQLENVTQTVTKFDGVAGSTVSMGPLSRLIVNGSAGSTFEGTLTGAAGGITKMGSDTLALTGTSSYGGTTIFAGGIVNVASLSDFGVDSSLGNRAADAGGDVGLLFRGGTLEYTGSTPQSTNRGIRISTVGGSATIDASGSDPSATLSFTAAASADFFELGGARGLILTGSNSGDNTFGIAIGQAGNVTNVAKTGVGTWVLTGANTYGGWTHIDAGTLRITTSAGLGAGGFDGTTMTVIANNAALELQGDLTITEHFHLQGAGPAGLGVLRSLSGNTSLTTNFALDNNSTFGVDAGTLTIAATIYQETGSYGVTKVGAGTLVLSGNNSYTGDTSVNAGTLSVTNNSATTFPDTSTVSIAATAVLDLPNAATDVVAALVINGTAVPNGVYDSSSPATTGYITGAGKLQVGASAYAAWAALNAGGGQADGDSDLDGLPNGIEYFMNAAAGFTANPQVVTVGGVSSITWPNGGNIPFTDYGTQFVVQTSADLTIWTDVPSTDGNLSNTSGAVTYTLPNGAGTIFVRLSVTPN